MVRKLQVLVFVLLLLINLGCGAQSRPVVNLSVHVNKLSDEEYDSVGTNGITNPTKADFRTLVFELRVEKLESVGKREIIVPAFEPVLNTYDGQNRIWSGQSTEQDNATENFAIYEKRYVLYTRGLSNDELKDMLSKLVVTCSWEPKAGDTETMIFNLGKEVKLYGNSH